MGNVNQERPTVIRWLIFRLTCLRSENPNLQRDILFPIFTDEHVPVSPLFLLAPDDDGLALRHHLGRHLPPVQAPGQGAAPPVRANLKIPDLRTNSDNTTLLMVPQNVI